MSSRLTAVRAVWVLPIVVVVCALMVLPAASVLGSAAGAPVSHSGSSEASAATAAAGALPTVSGKLASHNSPYSVPDVMQSLSPSSNLASLGSSKSTELYAQALDQIASHPGFSYDGVLRSIASEVAAGKVSPSSVYLPNLDLLESGPHSPGQAVGVGYTANPAPMGIGDFGIGSAGRYAYNTSHVAGSLTLNAANATYPGADYFITPPGNTNSSYNTPYEFGIQLNTVTTNVSIPGNPSGDFWTQNVVALNGNILQFEDNVWNFSSVSGALYPGTFYCDQAAGICYNGTPVYDAFYYDYGPVMKLTFPVTIDLYNNVSAVKDSDGVTRDQVTFGYRVVDSAGTIHGIYDTVTFNSTITPSSPTPGYEVNGKTATPLGLNWDSELIFGGPGGGSNAVFNNISGTESLSYSNESSGGWKTVPSAYDFGGDTGETAIGVAEYWNPGGTVGLSTGPSILYGLWNSQSSTAVPSGSIEYQGTLSPDWGFLFMDRASPFYYNTSYLPTNPSGGFLTYLPPGATYDVYALADGYTAIATSISTTTTGASITLTTGSDWSAPLYLNGNAQAQQAATVLAGWSSGPVKFVGFSFLWGINALFFNHLNDWGYVSWNEFQATGVTDVLNVTDMYQGTDNVSGPGQTNFDMDGPPLHSPPTLLGIIPAVTSSIPDYDNLIAFYSDSHVELYDQDLFGYLPGTPLDPSGYYNLNPAGAGAVLWSSPNAVVSHIFADFGTYGVVVAGSPHLTFYDGLAEFGANALSLQGSSWATVADVYGEYSMLWVNKEYSSSSPAEELPFGVYDLESTGGNFSFIYGEYGGVGFADYFGVGAFVNHSASIYPSINITGFGGLAVADYLAGATGTVINDSEAYAYAIGAEVLGGSSNKITNVYVDGLGTTGIGFAVGDGADYTSITNSFIVDTVEGALLEGAQNTTITNLTIVDVDFGVYDSVYNNYTTFNGLYISDVFDYGVGIGYSDNTAISNAYLNYDYYGIFLVYNLANTVNNVWSNSTTLYGITVLDSTSTVVTDLSDSYGIGLWAEDDSSVSVTTASVTDAVYTEGGVYFDYVNGGSVSKVTVTDFSFWGVVIADSTGVSVSQVAVNDSSFGVEIDPSSDITISGVSATDYSLGNYVDGSQDVTISGTMVSDWSLGDNIYESSQVTDVGATVSGSNSTGIFVEESSFVTVRNVTAAATTLTPLYEGVFYWGVPIAAVVTEDTAATTIASVTATNVGAALFDIESNGLQVSNVNDTGGDYAVALNGTYNGYFTGIGAFHDWIGFVLQGSYAEDNYVTGSSFVDSTSYGVAILDGAYNTFTMNNFIGNNGATGTYNPAHVQAWSDDYNYFYICTNDACTTGIGNYWADWHTYGPNGFLAPYVVTGTTEDLFPIGPEETFSVSFTETGLASGASWSVTLNGVTQSATTGTITFTIPMGTYSYQVSSVAGYTASPTSGSVTVSAAPYSVAVTFSANLYAVTLSAGGLSSATTWSATVNGVTQSTSGTSLVFELPAGTYTYAFNAVSGYNLGSGSSGSVTVTNAPVSLSASYSPTSTPSLASTSDLNNYFAVALALALIALVVALLALFLRRGQKAEPASKPPEAWSPPSESASTSGGGGGGGPTTGSASWSEGSGSQTPPPSS